jgi:hypothetical protein
MELQIFLYLENNSTIYFVYKVNFHASLMKKKLS